MPFGLEDREYDVPPCDSLAEGIVLYHMLFWPDDLAECDLAPLLLFREHRLLLNAMNVARRRTAGQPWARFYMVWLAECQRVAPHLCDVLDTVVADHWTWHINRLRENPDGPELAVGLHDWRWWLDRLKRVQVCRGLVDQAQDLATRAWRGDYDGALRVVERIDRPREVVRIAL